MINSHKYETIFCQQAQRIALDLQDLLKKLAQKSDNQDLLHEGKLLAHRLKSSSLTLGCHNLVNFSQVMEEIFDNALKGLLIIDARTIKEMAFACEIISKKSLDFKKLKEINFADSINDWEKLPGKE